VAGPIERAKHLLPQFSHFPRSGCGTSPTVVALSGGLFKKLAAGQLSLVLDVERVYENPKAFGPSSLVMATITFAWQIFFDFSGYTDMARGVAQADGVQSDVEFQQSVSFHRPR